MEKGKGINTLNLFSGINVTGLALKELGIKVNKSYQSEICPSAIKICQHHFPDAIQLGDIRNVDGHSLGHIDLVTVGSPCVDLSSLRKNRQGLEGEKSGLFFEALRILNEVKKNNPKCLYLFENVGSMSKRDKKRMDELIGIRGLSINSKLLSGQLRHRIYWTNIHGVTIPEDKNIKFQNIIEGNYFVDRDKSYCVLTKNVPHTKQGLLNRYLLKGIGQVKFHDKEFALLPKKEKIKVIENMDNEQVKSLFKPLSVLELERLQTLPDAYISGILPPTPGIRVIGNCFTKDIIKHILSFADF